MNSTCKKLQEMMAAEGPEVLQKDEAAQRHLEECEACFSFLETLQELNAGLREMPAVDAPDHIVDELLARPELQSPAETKVRAPEKHRPTIDWMRWTVWGSAAAFVLLAVTLSIPSLQRSRMSLPPAEESLGQWEDREGEEIGRFAGALSGEPEPPASPDPELQKRELKDSVREEVDGSVTRVDIPADKQDEDNFAFEAGKLPDDIGEEIDFFGVPGGVEGGVPEGVSGGIVGDLPDARSSERSRDEKEVPASAGRRNELTPRKIKDAAPVFPDAAKQKGVQGTVTLRIVIDQKGNVVEAEVVSAHPLLKQAAIDAVLKWKYEPQPAPTAFIVRVNFEPKEPGSESVDGLTFRSARGYWANTYLPGDPEMRFLHARLQQFSRAQLQAFMGKTPLLHEAAHQPFQPFDSPDSAAMALYLHADRKSVSGERRILVQVGLKGIERRAGRRPAMNVGVVLDLRGDIPMNVAQGMRALVTELNRAKELGDRLRLVVAGQPGSVVLGPEAFRHGTLTAALDQLFGQAPPVGDPTLDIVEAVKTTIQEVGNDDDPAAVLGSSIVLLITGQPFGEATRALATLAHQSAVAGIPVSAVGVGGNIQSAEINRVALAGQGNRRFLEKPSEAARLIDLELSAASRVVARAVRLSIRLAEGVRLVDILRSNPLDEVQAQQVRQAERSIDTRLNLNLGIEADRGEDEDGIQIVIPNFYAGDEHAILLDVVAPGPGAVAQVTMRYKDVAFLKNQVTQAGLSLVRGRETRGPLELNVLKNALAVRLAETLEQAGTALSQGQTAEAESVLTKHRDELIRRCSELPGLQDTDTRTDVQLIAEYLVLLATPAVQNASLRNHLADSLRYAGWLKIQPPLSVS